MKSSIAAISVLVVQIASCALSPGFAQAPANAGAQAGSSSRDGSHDFDFELGRWHTQLKRLVAPLSGSDQWVEYEGTSLVRQLFDGPANLVELDVQGPAGRIRGVSLRLYDADARQWSLNYAGVASGAMAVPTIGEFRDGRGEFYDQETYRGRAILVRFVITPLSADSCRFEQAYSDDGGKSWETNWIAVDTRLASEPGRSD
jgi:hypothetical protein